jgi:succinate dehydrogenase/fumarate reductase cytochrome b subunit
LVHKNAECGFRIAELILSFRFDTPNSELDMFPYYFIRFSGPLLLILVGLKILSGYSLVGRIQGISWLANLHLNRTLDIFLLFIFIFHALYGLRLFLIDLGMVKQEKFLFWAFTTVSAGLFIFSYVYFF